MVVKLEGSEVTKVECKEDLVGLTRHREARCNGNLWEVDIGKGFGDSL